MRRFAIVVTMLTLAIGGASIADAQPYRGDLLVVFTTPTTTERRMLRIAQNGNVTTVVNSLNGALTAVLTDFDNQNLILGGADGSIVVADPQTGATIRTLVAGGDMVSELCHDTNGDLLYLGWDGVRYTSKLYRVDRTSGSVLGASWVFDFPGVLIPDLLSGGVFVSDVLPFRPGRLFRVVGGTRTLLYQSTPPSFATAGVQDHTDGSVFLAVVPGAILRVDVTGSATVVRNGLFLPALAMDRDVGLGELMCYVAGSFYRLTRSGQTVSVLPTPPNFGTPANAVVERARNIVTERVGSPNLWQLRFHFPDDPGRAFVAGLSLSGFTPGFGAGGRLVSLAVDDLFRLSTSAGLRPWLRGNVGFLDATGRAIATLDLRSVSGLSGTRVWAAALSLDAAAPGGIATVTKPVVMVME